MNYITTWFYKESSSEASFYPQLGRKGDSPLVHSVYMRIQVPFFVTFKRYNPSAHFIFFTNIDEDMLPSWLRELFERLDVEVVRLSYGCMPPKGWHTAWMNQFFVYDIFRYMEQRMQADDVLVVSDADCVCRQSLDPLLSKVRAEGSALYELARDQDVERNGITSGQMNDIYRGCYGKEPEQPIYYYGGDFIALRTDKVKAVNQAYHPLWRYNLSLFSRQQPKLNEEAQFFSVLAEHLGIRNNFVNSCFKRIWTHPNLNTSTPDDLKLAIWHLPYEKRRGLTYLYRRLMKSALEMGDEDAFWADAAELCGIPRKSLRKRLLDVVQKVRDIINL